MKLLLTSTLFFLNLFAQTNFKETKNISAVGVDIVKYGNIEILKDQLIINYTKPNQETINYFNDRIEIINSKNTKTYSFEKYPNAQYMGLILRTIQSSEYELLDQFFQITQDKNTTILNAKPIINSYISSIEVTKGKQDTIKINMTNKDTITIETIN